MLRIIQNSRADCAKSYYSTADYYTEGQDLTGIWRGKGAARLGLEGEVSKDDWDALCDNRNPSTGKPLTPRQRDDRRVGYDFNFHVPKSLSLLYGLTKDERIVEAFRQAVGETMQDIEAEMQTRVRSNGRNEDRTTSNMVWGEFIHTTARPVDGTPDPHLHAHCFVFNTTWDTEESRWKAGQFAALKRDAPYFEAVFHSRLARGMEELGLRIERTKKGWELAGVPASALRRFSRRTELIEARVRKEGLTEAKAKGELGAKTRERKAKELTFDQLREVWRERLEPEEADALVEVAARLGGDRIGEDPAAARAAVARSLVHSFERNAVMSERRLLADAMKRSLGIASPKEVTTLVKAAQLIEAESQGQRFVTTKHVLAEEQRMLSFARRGRGTCARLHAAPYQPKRAWLNEGQRRAVDHLLTSRDRVILVRGAAGTGKTTMAQEGVEAIEQGGRRVLMFAPSAEASRGVLRNEGFKEADTVARLLVDEQLQAKARGQVLWIDEAGLLGSRAMGQVFDLAGRLDARVVLVGDRRQHGAVERGSPLRLLEREAGLAPVEIRDIQRQRGDYKRAVEALSEGQTEVGFRELDRLGWVRAVPDEDRYEVLTGDYAATVAEGKTALVIAPTHREGDQVTAHLRAKLKVTGSLKGDEREVRVLQSANLTEGERADPASYETGDVLVFHQNAKGHTKGDRVVVSGQPLPLDQAARFQVFRPGTLPVAKGEVLRITRNGTTLDGKHRLNNGARVTVKRLDRAGNLILSNGWKVARDFGHFAYGYVSTSHASQGKTVDRVLIGQSADSFPASSREQFYVSVSRGKERATIYTDDKAALLEAVSRSDVQLTATDLARKALEHPTPARLQPAKLRLLPSRPAQAPRAEPSEPIHE